MGLEVHRNNLTKLAISLAIIFTWISIWISFERLPYSADPFVDSDIVAAKSGFPFTVFYYPPAPFGNDVPDQGSIFPFVLNAMLYFILMWIILRILPEKYIKQSFERVTTHLAFWVTFVGLLHTILLYD